ncbi:hypothetical protein GFB49_12345 [Epibacterium sp. SM1979]|uniref:NADP-dependent oxidoreductase domain-containing protein n=1 Tax=Tritonibacter litoralis TaxID=2662264 RepID=A0A843YHE8_9RHOB|nr:hypothetical protein [Tritonibacter litoralis]
MGHFPFRRSLLCSATCRAKRILSLDQTSDQELVQICQELGVAFVAHSLLGRGMLVDQAPDPTRFVAKDFCKFNLRFLTPNIRPSLNRLLKCKAYAAAQRYRLEGCR